MIPRFNFKNMGPARYPQSTSFNDIPKRMQTLVTMNDSSFPHSLRPRGVRMAVRLDRSQN